MPYKFEGNLPRNKDRRVKLTEQQRDEITANKGGLSQRALARKYGVSRRTITFILDPDKLAANLQRREERGGSSLYYHTQSHTDSLRLHRRYRQVLNQHPDATLCNQYYHMWKGQDQCPKCHGISSQSVWMTSVPINT